VLIGLSYWRNLMYNLILCGIKIPKSIKMRYHELQVYVLSRLRHAAYITSLLRPRANVDALSLALCTPRLLHLANSGVCIYLAFVITCTFWQINQ